jgi:hypothetical protein
MSGAISGPAPASGTLNLVAAAEHVCGARHKASPIGRCRAPSWRLAVDLREHEDTVD